MVSPETERATASRSEQELLQLPSDWSTVVLTTTVAAEAGAAAGPRAVTASAAARRPRVPRLNPFPQSAFNRSMLPISLITLGSSDCQAHLSGAPGWCVRRIAGRKRLAHPL